MTTGRIKSIAEDFWIKQNSTQSFRENNTQSTSFITSDVIQKFQDLRTRVFLPRRKLLLEETNQNVKPICDPLTNGLWNLKQRIIRHGEIFHHEIVVKTSWGYCEDF
jgi:hypothetical protein